MLYFINRTYAPADWSNTLGSDNILYLNTGGGYTGSYDTIQFPGNILFASVSVSIQSYNLQYKDSTNPTYTVGSILAGVYPGTMSAVGTNAITFKPYLGLISGTNYINNNSAMLTLSIIAQVA